MEYLLLKQPLKTDRFSESLSFSISDELLKITKPNVSENYGQSVNYGFNPDDALLALSHALNNIILLYYHSPLDDDIEPLIRSSLIEDFKNYLHCLLCGNTKYAEYAPKLIEAFYIVGLAKEIADSIYHYYQECSANPSESKDCHSLFCALNLEKLYQSIGDKALFEDENIHLAIQYYRLSTLNWTEEEETYTANSWKDLVYQYLYLIYNSKADIPSSFFKQQDRSILISFHDFFNRNSTHQGLVENSNSFFTLLNAYLMDPDTGIDKIRTLLIMGWKVKLTCLLPALCCLYSEDADTRSCLSSEIVLNILSANIPEAPTGPLYTYAIAHQDDPDLSQELLCFARVLDLIQKIRNALRLHNMNQDMGYYTSLRTLMFMLPPDCKDPRNYGKLSVMHIAYMNDPNEGRMLHRFLAPGDEQTVRLQRKNAWYPYVFAKCFTSRIDDLPMWEMYGSQAQGCCIIIDWEKTLLSSNKQDTPLYRICYLRKSNGSYSILQEDNPDLSNADDIRAWLDELKHLYCLMNKSHTKQFFDDLLESIAYLFKDSNYHYEKEVRILYSFTKPNDCFHQTADEFHKLFVSTNFPIHIKEIIIGPKFKDLSLRLPYIQQQIEKMCDVTHCARPQITLSEIEYR